MSNLFVSPLKSAKPRVMLTALIVVSLAARLLVTWGTFDSLMAVLCDDAFYSLGIARSISKGYGPTFDGIVLTNGFQPLYVLFMVPIYWLLPSSELIPLRVALSAISIFSVGSLMLVWKIVFRLTHSKKAALTSCCIWTFWPVVFFQEMKGLETSISSFFIAAVTYYLVSRQRASGSPLELRRRELVTLGVLLGLALWTRVDNAFLLLGVLVHLVLIIGSRALLVGGIAAAVYVPWLAWSWKTFGTVLQVSGQASRFLYYHNQSSVMQGISRSLRSLSMKLAYEIIGHYRLAATFLLANTELLLFLVFVLAIFTGWLALTLRKAVSWTIVIDHARKISFLFIFCALVFAFYVFYFWRIDLRYFNSVYFSTAVLIGILVHGVSMRKPALSSILSKALVGGTVVLLALSLATIDYRIANKLLLYEATAWLNENAEQDTLVGSFNAGIVGYFSESRVINLDGLVNNEVFKAHQEGRFTEYVRESGIQYIVDFPNVSDWFGQSVKLSSLKTFEDHSLCAFQPYTWRVVVWRLCWQPR